MFSFVQNISSALKPLDIEAADTRLRRGQNPEEAVDHDKSGHKDDHADKSDSEANAFSINALICFLEDFLEARLSSKLNESVPQNVSSFAPWMKAEHSNTNEMPALPSKRAANAYAHGAEVMKKAGMPPTQDKQHQDEEKVNDVYHLLRDLRDLRDAGITHLRLTDGPTFLTGISSAVQMAKIGVAARGMNI
tara:strand:- start:27077 stop:27652 length:576 start_codon:yes stop_codon:yes gene_type:complete